MSSAPPIFAIVTPFDSTGAIDRAALSSYLDFLTERGVNRIIVAGTTGEFPGLSPTERKNLLEHCRKHFPGEIIAHVSATCVADVKDLLSHAGAFADASLLLPAYYYADAPAAGMLAYLVECARGSMLPLYLYNFPKHTQFPLTPDLLKKAQQQIPQLRGLKDSSGSFEKAADLARSAEGLDVYVGSDSSALRVLQDGLTGSVTGGANPVPHLILALYNSFVAGDVEAAQAHQEKLNQWSDIRKAFAAQEIAVVKSALSALIPNFQPYVRSPLLTVGDDMHREIRLTMETFR